MRFVSKTMLTLVAALVMSAGVAHAAPAMSGTHARVVRGAGPNAFVRLQVSGPKKVLPAFAVVKQGELKAISVQGVHERASKVDSTINTSRRGLFKDRRTVTIRVPLGGEFKAGDKVHVVAAHPTKDGYALSTLTPALQLPRSAAD